MRFRSVFWIICFTAVSLTDVFSGESLPCSLTADHPRCCVSGVHMLIHWKTNFPVSKLTSVDEPLASEDSEIFLNIDVNPNEEKNGYKISQKEFPGILKGSQTYVILPDICYYFDSVSGKLTYGISAKKDWAKGIITLGLRHPDGQRRSYEIQTKEEIQDSHITATSSRGIRRVPENSIYKLSIEEGIPCP